MPLIAPPSGSNFKPAPAGSHFARCFRMIDLGTHDEDYQGLARTVRKILLAFELPGELHTFREENGPEPFSLSREFTFSMHEKAGLRKFLEGWRSRAFTDEEAAKFDIAVLIGKACMLNVVHQEKGGKTYANIVSASMLPKGMQQFPPVNESTVLSLNHEEFDQQIYNKLPEWMQKKIQASKEWPSLQGHGNHSQEEYQEEGSWVDEEGPGF